MPCPRGQWPTSLSFDVQQWHFDHVHSFSCKIELWPRFWWCDILSCPLMYSYEIWTMRWHSIFLKCNLFYLFFLFASNPISPDPDDFVLVEFLSFQDYHSCCFVLKISVNIRCYSINLLKDVNLMCYIKYVAVDKYVLVVLYFKV
jgi:hypothetical protein